MNKWVGALAVLFVPVVAIASGEQPDSAGALDEIQQGRQVYEQSCAVCHGWQGEGAAVWQQPDEKGEMPAPPHDETGHTWRHSDAMLFKMIAKGWRHPFNETDRLTMPAFEDELTDREIRAVIEYLKTLWTNEQRDYRN
ncbi:cytochrome c [Neopusillimonas maritima]|jgi:mono/diheme cytochrome c family protein|uniref:Cytochrome C n=1 Tax=Neopusillimonas maritima TaxID=2026239 RepID=A0ABX9MV73_9BURK|nr:cytochrome c [Neopusillimonas maritima]RII82835.1 cytochrome C [Neopusillimonas maritima]|tara:strand:- start:1046 stop:1462 length:417 start_codon:yes stop_codon:yes gene_type:complete